LTSWISTGYRISDVGLKAQGEINFSEEYQFETIISELTRLISMDLNGGTMTLTLSYLLKVATS